MLYRDPVDHSVSVLADTRLINEAVEKACGDGEHFQTVDSRFATSTMSNVMIL